MNILEDEDDITVSAEKKILRFIYENDVRSLRDMKLHLRDLNFLEEYPEVEVDISITPLILASHLGRIEILKMLLENEGIDINATSSDLKLTPLCAACAAGNYETIEMLISNGADVNKSDALNRMPLYFAFLRLQEDTNIFENSLICMKMAQILVKSGAEVDLPLNKEKGTTLLIEYCNVASGIEMSAREKDINLKVIKFLLENGADPNKKSKKGKSAYNYANKHPYKEDVLFALRNIKPTSTQQNSRETSYFIAQPKVKKRKLFSMEGGSLKDTCCNIFDCWNKRPVPNQL